MFEQGKFIGEVGVKGGPVDFRSPGDVLDRDALESFFGDQRVKSLFDQAAGTYGVTLLNSQLCAGYAEAASKDACSGDHIYLAYP